MCLVHLDLDKVFCPAITLQVDSHRVFQSPNKAIFILFNCFPFTYMYHSAIHTATWNCGYRTFILPKHQVIFYNSSRSTQKGSTDQCLSATSFLEEFQIALAVVMAN